MAPDRSLEEMLSREAVSMLGEIGVKALLEPSERDHGDATMYTLDMDIAKEIVLRRFASVRSALSPVQGEELPERPDTDCSYDNGSFMQRYEEAYKSYTANAHFDKLETLLRAAQAEIGRLKGELDQIKSLLIDASLAAGGHILDSVSVEFLAHIPEEIRLALSTCRADVLRECLGAVRATRIPEYEELTARPAGQPLSLDDGLRWACIRGTQMAEQAILALPKAGK